MGRDNFLRIKELLMEIACLDDIIETRLIVDAVAQQNKSFLDDMVVRLREIYKILLYRQAEIIADWQNSDSSRGMLYSYSMWHLIWGFWLSRRQVFEATTWIAFGMVPPVSNIYYDQKWGGLEVVLCAGFCIAVSLAVLWGVCWMFYWNPLPYEDSQNGEFGEEASAQEAGFGEYAGDQGNLTDTLDYGGTINNSFPVQGSYIWQVPETPMDIFPTPLTSWPDFEAAGLLDFDPGQDMITQAVPTKSTVPKLNRSHLTEHASSPAPLPASLGTASLSPNTDPTTQTSYNQQGPSTPRLSKILSIPKVLGHAEQRVSISEKPLFSREGQTLSNPPQNNINESYCDHPDCASSPPTFRRTCDWSKHMDKHTRPYHCNNPGCRYLPGFTSKGDLTRHQKQVHGQHGGPPIYQCPHSGCKRSSGKGFARKENLADHLKRIHEDAGTTRRNQDATYGRAVSEHLELSPPADSIQLGRKRRRAVGDDVADGTAEAAQALDMDLMVEVKSLKAEHKRLRSIITEKDIAITEKDAQLKMLQEMLEKALKG